MIRLNRQAEDLFDEGRYGEAIPLAERATEISEQTFGPENAITASLLINQGELYRATGAYGKAEPLVQRALAIREKALGPEHPDTAASLSNLAELYRATGAYAKAEPLFQRALAIREKALGPEHPDTGGSLNDLANLYHANGTYTEAEPLYQRSLAIAEKVFGPEHPDTATALNNLAELYHTTGAYAQAEPLYQRSLAIAEKVFGPEHPHTARALNSLAELYRATGAYGKAEPLVQRALAISEKVLGPEHPDTAWSLGNLAGIYYVAGAYPQAEQLYQRSLAIAEKVFGPEHPHTATALNNLAELYHTTGAYAQAEPLYQRSLAIAEKVFGPEHPHTALSLINLAVWQWASGKLTAAVGSMQRAQTIQERNTRDFLLTGSETRKQAYQQQFRGKAYAAISLSLAGVSHDATGLGLTSVLQAKGLVLDAMADSVAKLRASVTPEDRALFDRLAAIAQQRSVLVYQGPGKLSPEAYRSRLGELSTKQEQLESELSTRSADFRQQVAPISLAAVQRALPTDSVLVEWFRYQPFDPKAKEQKAQWDKPRYVAYVLRHDGEPAVVDVGDAEMIERLIHDFRAGLGHRTSTYVNDVAKELYDKLVKPLRPHLGNAERLLLSPDGALNLMPFAALMDEQGTYLTSKVEIIYLTSGRDLMRFGAASLSRGDAVVVADPDYGKATGLIAQGDPGIQPSRSVDLDRRGMVFTPLPGTAEEGRALKTLLRVEDEKVLTQAKATEDRLKQLHGPRILHIATHGFFLKDNELPAAALKTDGFSQDQRAVPLSENPLLRSGLALAGANERRSGEHDDGILTAAEVAQLDLRDTQLVVLSACETGLGEVQNGEGVYGLRRALVLAGAQTQVTSLWKVADDATKDLMVEYYQRLLKGEGRSAALRETQRTMINSKARSHPYYWAAFVPIGNWQPLAQ
jgi:CHAT domain-containing protein/tetratricopeptide (TPR) repeat protein